MSRHPDIIIPIYKPGESFKELLSGLNAQTLAYNRLIIFNTLPEEGTNAGEVEKLLETAAGGREKYILRHIKRQDFDHAGTRKKAASLSKADAFICMTQDALPADDRLLEKLMDALFSDALIASAYARQLARPGASPIEEYTRNFNYPAKRCVKSREDVRRLGIKAYFSSNVCCAYKAELYEETGGFTESAGFNEDMIFVHDAMEKGFLSCYEPEARVYHSHEYTAMQELRRNFDNGMSQAVHSRVFSGISPEGEGVRLVLGNAAFLLKKGRPWLIPRLFMVSAAKYLGFGLGRNYKKLPAGLALSLSMNKVYTGKVLEGVKQKGK